MKSVYFIIIIKVVEWKNLNPPGIHNKALEHFISKLLSVCEKNNVQLFLTTHSLETIDVLLEDCRDTLDDIAFYHIRNSEEQSVTRRYSGKKLLDLRTEIGFDIR